MPVVTSGRAFSIVGHVSNQSCRAPLSVPSPHALFLILSLFLLHLSASPSREPDRLVTFTFSFSQVPSTRLVHFLRAPDPCHPMGPPPSTFLARAIINREQTRR